MKVSIVPAQVTTVEDKIINNLTLTQLLILVSPMCLSGLIYSVLPPTFQFNFYKLDLVFLVTPVTGILAFRFKGKLVVNWLIIIIRYSSRLRTFVYDKNNLYLRARNIRKPQQTALPDGNRTKISDDFPNRILNLSLTDKVFLESLIAESKNSIRIYLNKDGGFNVVFKEVKK